KYGADGLPGGVPELSFLVEIEQIDLNFQAVEVLRRRGRIEAELAAIPLQRLKQRLSKLEVQGVQDHWLGDQPDHRKDFPEEDLGLLLSLEGFVELVLGEIAEVDQDLAKVLARLVGAGVDDRAVLDLQPLAELIALDVEVAAGALVAQVEDDVPQGHR